MYHFQILHAQSKFPISGRLLFYQYSYRQEGVYWVLKHALGEVLHRLVFWFNPREPHLQHGTWNPKISRNHPEWVVGPGFALQPEAIAWLLPSAQWKSPKQKFIYLLIHSFNLCFVPQNYCKVVPNRFNRMNFFFFNNTNANYIHRCWMNLCSKVEHIPTSCCSPKAPWIQS